VWLNTNWLIEAGLRQHGRARRAEEIVASSLRLVADNGYFEYFDPFTGSGYGGADFSWTADLAIDLARRGAAGGPPETGGSA
jgi:Mannosylglycerate hydrolase MGH1-like glycoside hydrolase domain